MAEEGQVISCHTVEAWNEHLQKENESKKLVCLTTIYSLFIFWCVIFFSYSTLSFFFLPNFGFSVFKVLGVTIT
jgi:membrane-associated HD superfamily phosphohydrolase